MIRNRLAIASVSLGQHATHTLPRKITAAAETGIQGIEITWPDLEQYASSLDVEILEAARRIRQLCKERHLTILSLASFQNFEGAWSPLSQRLDKARQWLGVAHALGAEHLQIPSNYDRAANGDRGVIVADLRALADLASTYDPVIKVAYENLAWGTHCNLWQHALENVQAVNRDNFGLCLDSFHECVALWGDAFRVDGRQPGGDRQLHESMREMVRRLPLDKLFYLQLSDGERLSPPYSEAHPWFDPSLAPGHVWSNEARPFPLEVDYGAYMPVTEVARAFLVDLGYTGWVSLETFDRRMKLEENGALRSASRAVASWDRLKIALSSSKGGKARL